MTIMRANTGITKRGPADYFAGAVWLNELTVPPYTSDVRAAIVTFEPDARTAWHTHPHGQLLRILSGVGRVQKFDGDVVEVLPGDVIWFEPGERHWHGAARDRMMEHLAIQRADANGKTADWLEHVTDVETSEPILTEAIQRPARGTH